MTRECEIHENYTIFDSLTLLNLSDMETLLEPTFMGDVEEKNKLPLLKEIQYNSSLFLKDFLYSCISSTNSKNQIALIS